MIDNPNAATAARLMRDLDALNSLVYATQQLLLGIERDAEQLAQKAMGGVKAEEEDDKLGIDL